MRKPIGMKSVVFLVAVIVVFSGCVSPKYNYTPQRTEISEPPLDTVVTAQIGDAMLRQGTYGEYDAIFLRNDVSVGTFGAYTFTRGYYLKKGEDEKSEYYLPSGGPDSGQVRKGALNDPFQVIRVDRNTGRFCAVTVFNVEVCTDRIDYERKKLPSASPDSFQQTLIYSGKVGNKINVGYREFSNNSARPAFNNDVEYDLSSSKSIGYKGAKIEVIEATNEYIKYRVIQNFNRAQF